RLPPWGRAAPPPGPPARLDPSPTRKRGGNDTSPTRKRGEIDTSPKRQRGEIDTSPKRQRGERPSRPPPGRHRPQPCATWTSPPRNGVRRMVHLIAGRARGKGAPAPLRWRGL